MKKVLPVLLVMFWYGTASGQDTVRITLAEAIEIGIDQSVDAVVAWNEFITSYWEYRTYRTELLPEAVFTATTPYYSKSYNSFQNSDGSYTYVGNDYYRLNSGISVSQNLPFSGGKLTMETNLEMLRQNGNNSSRRFYSTPFAVRLDQPVFGFNRIKWLQRIEPVKYEIARKKLASDREEVALTAIGYYFDLLLARINLDIAIQNKDNAEKLYEIAKARREIGQISEMDLLQMETSLLKAESSRTLATANYESQMFNLRSFLNLGENMVLVPEIPEVSLEDFPALDYRTVLNYALSNYYFMDNIRKRMLEAQREVSQAKADRRSVNLYASFGMSGQENTFRRSYNSGNWRNDHIISVGVSIPILDWGKGKGKVRTAEAAMEVTQSRIEKEQTDFRQDIYMQVMNFNNQPMQLRLAMQTDNIAARRYETTVEAFILGKTDILTLNDSQLSKDEARREYINQLFLLWSYHYVIRSLTLYDFTQGIPLETEKPTGKRLSRSDFITNFTF